MEQRLGTALGTAFGAALGTALGAGAYVGGSTALLVAVLTPFLAQVPPAAAVPAGTVAGAVAAFVAWRSYDRTAGIARRSVAAVLLALPAAGAAVVLTVGSSGDWTAFRPGIWSAIVALVGWFVLRRTASTIHARRFVGDEAPLASLPIPDDRTASPRLRRLNAAFAVLLVVWGLAALLSGSEQWWYPSLLLAAPATVLLDTLRGVTVTEDGIVVARRLGARCYEWSDFEAYYLGDQRLVLLRPAWWRDDLEFDRESVSDDALAIVAQRLPRAPAPVVPVGGFRQPASDSSSEQPVRR